MSEYIVDKFEFGGNLYKLQDNTSGYTKNTGTVTGIKMNNSTLSPTNGVVDIGTVITSHQDISGKADKSATVSTVTYDSTNKKLTKTINGTTTDVVTVATLKTAMDIPTYQNGTGIAFSMVDGSPISINHSNSVTAQTTQAVYPIKIDAQGHISAYGSAVTIPTIPSNNVTGSGTSGYLVKFNGTNTITNGPQLGSSTTTFLRNDGSWVVPYESKTAASSGTDVSLVTTGEKYTWNNKQNALSTETITIPITKETGTTFSVEGRKYGNIIQMTIEFTNTSSVASSSNVFKGQITNSAYRPKILANGAGYYTNHALVMSVNTDGEIIIRNAGSTAVTVTSATKVSATWII